jgi:hypothetical protein
MKTLAEIQKELKAPKEQLNSFGKYKYRSCEDIVEAAKTVLGEWALTISDEMVEVGGRVYVKATASITNGDKFHQATAFALCTRARIKKRNGPFANHWCRI